MPVITRRLASAAILALMAGSAHAQDGDAAAGHAFRSRSMPCLPYGRGQAAETKTSFSGDYPLAFMTSGLACLSASL
jgi:hypothetical protein